MLPLTVLVVAACMVWILAYRERSRRRPVVHYDTAPRDPKPLGREQVVGHRIVDLIETPTQVIVPVGETPFGLASREVFVVLDDGTLLHLDAGVDPTRGFPMRSIELPPCPTTRSEVAARVAGETVIEVISSARWQFGLALSNRCVLHFTMPGMTAFMACIDPLDDVEEPKYLMTGLALRWDDVYSAAPSNKTDELG
jgi:hypothetical protein